MSEKLAVQGAIPVGNTADEFARFVKERDGHSGASSRRRSGSSRIERRGIAREIRCAGETMQRGSHALGSVRTSASVA